MTDTKSLLCPACEEGVVEALWIPAIRFEGQCCRECEALWMEDQPVQADEFRQLMSFLREHAYNMKLDLYHCAKRRPLCLIEW